MTNSKPYVTPKIKRISKGTTDDVIMTALSADDAISVDGLVEELSLNRGSVGGRLAVLVDNGYVGREKIDGYFYYTKLTHKRQYDPYRRYSPARKKAALAALEEHPQMNLNVKDVTPIRTVTTTNKFDEVIQALEKANMIDEVKQKVRAKMTDIQGNLSDIDDLLASL